MQSIGQLEPSKDELLQIVFSRVDDSMLREIAAADYGQDVDEHLKQLLAIKHGKVHVPMRWEPREVLELIRWSEPEDPTWSPGSTGERGHWMRLFACSALLRAAAEPANEGYFMGEDSTIIQLVDSGIKLGKKTATATLRFLSWCMQQRSPNSYDRPYFAVAILILLVFLDRCDPESEAIAIAATISEHSTHSELIDESQKAKTWRRLIQGFLMDSKKTSQEIRELAEVLVNGDGEE